MRTTLATCVALAFVRLLFSDTPYAAEPMRFEQMVQLSDRIVVGRVAAPTREQIDLPNGKTVTLGVKDDNRVVMTPHRLEVSSCVLDRGEACAPGEIEVWVPGGVYWGEVDGERRLLETSFHGPVGLPLPAVGTELVLFLKERDGGAAFQPIAHHNARIPLIGSGATARVRLEFSSPRFLTDQAKAAPENLRFLEAPPGRTAMPAAPRFVESVPISRFETLVRTAIQGRANKQRVAK